MNCPQCVAYLAEIASIQAIIAGMQASNSQYPENQPHSEAAFFAEAAKLQDIAERARNH